MPKQIYKDRILDDALVTNSKLKTPISIDRGSCVDRSVLDPFISIGCFTYLTRSRVGAFTSIGSRCSIGGFDHEMLSSSTFGVEKFLKKISCGSTARGINQNTLIMPDTWIADNVVVLSGCTLGVGSIIGAGSVVTASTEPYGVYVGNPARRLRGRFTKRITQRLLDSSWWNADPFEVAPYMDRRPEEFLEFLRASV